MFQSNGFGPLQSFFENLGVHWDSNSQSGSSLESVEVHSLTLSHTPRSMKCDTRASLLAYTFASPCIGCKLKAKVATQMMHAHLMVLPILSCPFSLCHFFGHLIGYEHGFIIKIHSSFIVL